MDKLIILLVLLAILMVFILLALRGKKQIIYKMIYALVDEAEELYGSKTGKLKFSYVIEKVYAILPSTIKIIISYKTLEKWIEKALVEMKEYWAEQAEITE
jgi:hypothetical protein